MFYLRFTNLLPLTVIALLCATLFIAPLPVSARQDTGGDVRADLPSNGALRIENRRGNVSVEVWSERYVSVTATMDGAAPKLSPVRIARTDELLSVSTARTATPANLPRINLSLRIPERSRAEIITANGEVQLRGTLPAALTVRTVAGDIRAEASLSSLKDIDITAQSASGVATYTLALPDIIQPSGNGKSFHVRLGTGAKLVRLLSESGRISLGASGAGVNIATTESATHSTQIQSPPVLRGTRSETQRAAVAAPAADPSAPQEIDDGDVIRVDTQLVTINANVVDRSTNRGLTGLTQNDFKLYEDRAEQQITHFESAAAPFNLVLLIDLSGSTKDVVNLIRGAALRFVEAARPADRIAVITFASEPVIVSRLTSDRRLLRQRINAIEQPHGSTKLYDAVNFTIDEVLKDAKDSRRNAIVLMSDGLDSQLPNVKGDGSSVSYKELFRRVQEFDGVLYALWLNTEYESLSEQDIQPETFDAAHDRMKELAEAGGGIFYEVAKLTDLAGAYERVVADLGTVYSFSYRPTNKAHDGSWRTIRLSVARPNAVARGKRGYYAN
ncbi:MAG: VWA domain-containing protein [Pyrinomonadaceae bacterium]